MMALRFRSHIVYPRRGFALVITLVMVALLAIITIGVFTSVSLERVTAKSYNDRYQADLAAQNGLEAVKKTLGRFAWRVPLVASFRHRHRHVFSRARGQRTPRNASVLLSCSTVDWDQSNDNLLSAFFFFSRSDCPGCSDTDD